MNREDADRLAAKNRRTGLILAGIALAFFVGFVLRRFFQ